MPDQDNEVDPTVPQDVSIWSLSSIAGDLAQKFTARRDRVWEDARDTMDMYERGNIYEVVEVEFETLASLTTTESHTDGESSGSGADGGVGGSAGPVSLEVGVSTSQTHESSQTNSTQIDNARRVSFTLAPYTTREHDESR